MAKVAMKTPKIVTGRTLPWVRTIFGSPQSKANSRRAILQGGKPRFIKSAAALAYSDDFLRQCPWLDPLFECDLVLEDDIYYSSRRPDLDESLIMDLLQGRVYANDRQIRRKVITGHVDKENPRVDIRIYPYEPGSTTQLQCPEPS